MYPRRPTYRPAPFRPAPSAGSGAGAPQGGGGLGSLINKGLSIYEMADKIASLGSAAFGSGAASSAALPTSMSSMLATPFSAAQYATPVGTTLSGTGAATTGLASAMPFVGPAVVGALAIPSLMAIHKKFSQNKTDQEQRRMRSLAAQGYKYGREADFIDRKDSGFRADLAPDFVGRDSTGAYVNNRFARSRNERDLTPETISEPTGVGRAGFIKEFGNAWDERLNDSQRNQLIQDAINRGLIDEKKGSIHLNADQDLKRKALYMMNGITF